MTTHKLPPTHSFSHRGQAAAPSAHDKPRCQGAGAPTRVTPPSLTPCLSSFWRPTLRRQAQQEIPPPPHHPKGPSGQVSHHYSSPQVCSPVRTWHLHFESSTILTTTYSCSLAIFLVIPQLGFSYSWASATAELCFRMSLFNLLMCVSCY